MGQAKSLSFAPRRKWLVLLLRLLTLEHVMFGIVKSEGQAQTPGLLCISECYTCPEICSPPPAPPQSKPPPVVLSPPVHSSSPLPPQSYLYKSPPPPPRRSSPPPPSGPYISWGSNPPPPPPSPPYISWGSNPPPPPPRYQNIPTVQAPPNNGGNRNSSTFPYYYFYASKSNSVSPPFSFVGMVLLSFFIVMLYWQEGK